MTSPGLDGVRIPLGGLRAPVAVPSREVKGAGRKPASGIEPSLFDGRKRSQGVTWARSRPTGRRHGPGRWRIHAATRPGLLNRCVTVQTRAGARCYGVNWAAPCNAYPARGWPSASGRGPLVASAPPTRIGFINAILGVYSRCGVRGPHAPTIGVGHVDPRCRPGPPSGGRPTLLPALVPRGSTIANAMCGSALAAHRRSRGAFCGHLPAPAPDPDSEVSNRGARLARPQIAQGRARKLWCASARRAGLRVANPKRRRAR